MAIALQETGKGDSGVTASTDTISITNFTVDGSNKVLFVAVAANDTADLTPAVVWDQAGVNESLSPVTGAECITTGRYLNVFYKIAPTDGATKTISISGMSTAARDSAIAVLLSGVDQATPFDTVDKQQSNGASNPHSSATITSPAGDWILGFGAFSNNSGNTVNTGSGNVFIDNQANGVNITAAYDPDGADDAIDWTTTSGPAASAVTFNVNAAGGAAASKPKSFALMGVSG